MENANSPSQKDNHLLVNSFKNLHQHEVIYLSAEDSRVFLEALENPPPLNNKLKAAMREHQRRVISQ